MPAKAAPWAARRSALIAPVLARLAAEGMALIGPLPADTMFHAAARARYDAAVCMYHDQALIPIKTLAFDDGVNVTLGLPFVRTSPDHGTAFDIAGTRRGQPVVADRGAADGGADGGGAAADERRHAASPRPRRRRERDAPRGPVDVARSGSGSLAGMLARSGLGRGRHGD